MTDHPPVTIRQMTPAEVAAMKALPPSWQVHCHVLGPFGHSWDGPKRRRKWRIHLDFAMHRLRTGCTERMPCA